MIRAAECGDSEKFCAGTCGPATSTPGDYAHEAPGCVWQGICGAVESEEECEDKCIADGAKLCALAQDDTTCYAYFEVTTGACLPTSNRRDGYHRWETCIDASTATGVLSSHMSDLHCVHAKLTMRCTLCSTDAGSEGTRLSMMEHQSGAAPKFHSCPLNI